MNICIHDGIIPYNKMEINGKLFDWEWFTPKRILILQMNCIENKMITEVKVNLIKDMKDILN